MGHRVSRVAHRDHFDGASYALASIRFSAWSARRCCSAPRPAGDSDVGPSGACRWLLPTSPFAEISRPSCCVPRHRPDSTGRLAKTVQWPRPRNPQGSPAILVSRDSVVAQPAAPSSARGWLRSDVRLVERTGRSEPRCKRAERGTDDATQHAKMSARPAWRDVASDPSDDRSPARRMAMLARLVKMVGDVGVRLNGECVDESKRGRERDAEDPQFIERRAWPPAVNQQLAPPGTATG